MTAVPEPDFGADIGPGFDSDFAPDVGPDRRPSPRRRINADPEQVERGLVSLVLTVVELLRQLMERQALRRVDVGDLSDLEIERIGLTLMALEKQMDHLRDHFGLEREDLNIDLGPLGSLLPRD